MTDKHADDPGAGPLAASLEPSPWSSRFWNPVNRLERVKGQVCGHSTPLPTPLVCGVRRKLSLRLQGGVGEQISGNKSF